MGSLLISHLIWKNSEAQLTFSTDDIIKRLSFLIDFNKLANKSDPNQSDDSLMEICFYSLLALVNLS